LKLGGIAGLLPRPSSSRSLAIVSPVWSPRTAAIGHTRALAKQGQQTVRIETFAGQLSTQGRDDNSLFSPSETGGGKEGPGRQRYRPASVLFNRTLPVDNLAHEAALPLGSLPIHPP